MIRFSEEAIAFVNEKGSSVLIDSPYTVRGCCFRLTECPTIRFGQPVDPETHIRKDVQGLELYVPKGLPERALTVGLRNFLGFRSLFIDGWKPS